MTSTDRANLKALVAEMTKAGDLALDEFEQRYYADLTRIALQGEVLLPHDLELLRCLAWFVRGLVLHRGALLELQNASRRPEKES